MNKRVILTVCFVALVALAGLLEANSLLAKNQKVVVTAPPGFQQGVLVNNDTRTFPVDTEWNWRLVADKNVTIRLFFKGGVGISCWFIYNPENSPPQTYFNHIIINQTDPVGVWLGTIRTSGAYQLELGNLGDENNVATVQVYAEAV